MNRVFAAAAVAFLAVSIAAAQMPPPIVTGVSPEHVIAGSPETVITITGSNFTQFDEVLYKDWWFPATYVDATHLTVTIPADLLSFPSNGYLLVWGGYENGYSEPVPFSVTIPFTTPPNLPPGTTGVPYLQAIGINAEGTYPPYTWSVSAGALPPGLSLDPETGVLSGVPTAAGVYSFTLGVEDSYSNYGEAPASIYYGNWGEQTFVLTINPAQSPLAIWFPETLPDGAVSRLYGETLYASGGSGPYTWSGSSLPPGLMLVSSGVVVGTPTEPGTFRFSVTVMDAKGASASKEYSIRISEPALRIVTASPLPPGRVGSAYSAKLSVEGGEPPFAWTVNAFPPGLKLDGATGAISGTPSTAGTFTFTAQVTDAARNMSKKDFLLVVGPPALSIETASPLPAGVEGAAYTATFAAKWGSPPYTWTLGGTAPPGLALDPATGVLGGAPLGAGSFSFEVQVRDSAGATASKAFSLAINRAPLAIVTASLPGANVGAPYSLRLEASGGVPPYAWATGGLPPGLSLDAASGMLSGTPSSVGTTTLLVQVTDSEKSIAARELRLTIGPRFLEIATGALAEATAGASYSQALTAVGGAPPYSWSVTGSLPAGIALNAATGTLTGTPGAGGSFGLVVRVADSAGASVTKAFTLTVRAPPLPQINLGGSGSANPAEQVKVTATLGSGYPLKLSGQLTLTFTPDASPAADDPAIQFATGGRTFDFAVDPNTPAFPDAGLQTGTVAGTIVVALARLEAGGIDVTPSPPLTRTIVVNRRAPTITGVAIVRTGTGFEVQVTGYSTPREVSQARFTFAAAPGSSLQSADMTVPVGTVFTTWYNDAASKAFGSMFRYVQPFTVQGGVNGLASVTVTLSNSIGTSQPATANF
jgi:hypothetical protein